MQAPLWLKVALYARAHRDPAGTVFLERGDLRRALHNPNPRKVREAVALAVRYGWLAQGSTTRVLVLEVVPCPCGQHHPAPAARHLERTPR